MKVLTVRQPWAWAIFHAGKDIETRTWTTGHRGPLLIYVGNTYDEDGERDLFAMGLEIPGYEVPALVRGGIIGVVDLVESMQALTPERVKLGPLSPHESHVATARWYTGGCSWLLERPLALPFYAAGDSLRGRGGLLDFDEGMLPPETRALLADWMKGATP